MYLHLCKCLNTYSTCSAAVVYAQIKNSIARAPPSCKILKPKVDNRPCRESVRFRQALRWTKLHDCWHAIPFWLETRRNKARNFWMSGEEIDLNEGVIDIVPGLGGGIPQEVLLIVVEFCLVGIMRELRNLILYRT